jgi:hypothetical protein
MTMSMKGILFTSQTQNLRIQEEEQRADISLARGLTRSSCRIRFFQSWGNVPPLLVFSPRITSMAAI